MGEILNNHNGTKLDPLLKDVGYLTSNGKKAVGVLGEVMLVDEDGTAVNMTDFDVDIHSMIGGSTYVGKAAGATNADFTVAYTAATQVTLSGYPAGVTGFLDDDIELVRQISTLGVVTATYNRDDAAMTIAANVLTIAGAAFVNTDTFVVVTNVARPAASSGSSVGGGDTIYSNV